MNEREEFQAIVKDAEELPRRAIRAFAEWFAREWALTPEQWKKAYGDPLPGGQEWFDGHNAAVEGVLVAVNCFLDEYERR